MKIPYKRRLAGTFGIDELKELDTKTLHAVLATVHDDIPCTSLVAYAFDYQEKVFVFLTARKTIDSDKAGSQHNKKEIHQDEIFNYLRTS